MWAEACAMLDRADRLHRQFFRPALLYARQMVWEPPIDIYESDNGLTVTITIALPGVEPEQISVSLDGNHLLIGGQRHLPNHSGAHIRRLEIPYGRFERHVELPAARLEIAGREFVNGCLSITLRKR